MWGETCLCAPPATSEAPLTLLRTVPLYTDAVAGPSLSSTVVMAVQETHNRSRRTVRRKHLTIIRRLPFAHALWWEERGGVEPSPSGHCSPASLCQPLPASHVLDWESIERPFRRTPLCGVGCKPHLPIDRVSYAYGSEYQTAAPLYTRLKTQVKGLVEQLH